MTIRYQKIQYLYADKVATAVFLRGSGAQMSG